MARGSEEGLLCPEEARVGFDEKREWVLTRSGWQAQYRQRR